MSLVLAHALPAGVSSSKVVNLVLNESERGAIDSESATGHLDASVGLLMRFAFTPAAASVPSVQWPRGEAIHPEENTERLSVVSEF